MPFNVNEFRSSFSTVGEPTSAAAFEVRVVGFPPILPSSMARDMLFRCEGASIPSKTLQTVERRTYGPVRKIAYGASYDEITLTFIVSSSMNERNFFSAWQSIIIDSASGGDVSYYDDYVGRIQIVTFDHKGNENLQITLVEAYPVSVQQIDLNWGEKNSYMRVSVTFAYRYYVDQQGVGFNGLNSLLGSLATGFQLLNNIKNLRDQVRKGGLGAVTALISAAGSANRVIEGVTGIDSIKSISSSIGSTVTPMKQSFTQATTKAGGAFRQAVSNTSSSVKKAFGL